MLSGLATIEMAMVDLEPILEESERMERLVRKGADLESHGLVDVMGDMTRNDDERLRKLIENHLHYTGSSRAQGILDDWETVRDRFVKIMPVEYRRALAEMAKHRKADTTGLDVLEIGLPGGK